MSSTTYSFGGATISIDVASISKTTPQDPKVAPDIHSLVAMMEKAHFCGKDEDFSKCLASFLEEIDNYLDDRRIEESPVMDEKTIRGMEDFMNQHLPPGVLKNVKKLGRKR